MKALLISHSNLRRDPRVNRQIRWLRTLGFSQIVSIGRGQRPDGSDLHFNVPTPSLLLRILAYVFLSHPRRFRFFYGSHLDRIGSHVDINFDLIVVNETEYLAWELLQSETAKSTPTYLDIHEVHSESRARNWVEHLLFTNYWKEEWKKCKDFVSTRKGPLRVTTVASQIAELYEAELGISVGVISNATENFSMSPSEVREHDIRLIHHGFGTRGRGIEAAIMALRYLPPSYSLTLVLFASEVFKLKLRALARILKVSNRLHFIEPVDQSRLSPLLRNFDIAVITPPPINLGNQMSLPNKFFESIQGKLALVVSESLCMVPLVEKYGNGIIVRDLSAKALAKEIAKLSPQKISEMKANSEEASKFLNQGNNETVFASVIISLLQDDVGALD